VGRGVDEVEDCWVVEDGSLRGTLREEEARHLLEVTVLSKILEYSRISVFEWMDGKMK